MGDTEAVRTCGLTRRYGRLVAVDHVDYLVPTGSVCGLIGPNGAGKTTLISLLAGYLRPSHGSGVLLGCPLNSAGLRGRITVLPQNATFPPRRRAVDLLTFYGELTGARAPDAAGAARAALAAVGLQDRARDRAGHLSHGMARRLGLAQACLGRPDLVLLDEPTAGLDPRTAFEVRRLIAGLRGRATVVVASHNLAELQSLCDYATILNRGRIVAQGPLDELTRADEEVRVGIRGNAPVLAEVARLEGVVEADLAEEGQLLVVRFSSHQVPAERGTAALLRYLLDRGTVVTSLNRGRSLEQRFLELT
jgi:ABC-2 type transport system ATP-binding protein